MQTKEVRELLLVNNCFLTGPHRAGEGGGLWHFAAGFNQSSEIAGGPRLTINNVYLLH